MAELIQVTNISHAFESGPPVLDHFTLSIQQGDFVTLLGPSGCGKSTLLRILSGLEAPRSGNIQFQAPLTSLKRSFVFQEAALLPWRTAAQNVALPLELLKQGSQQDQLEKARSILKSLGLAASEHLYPHQLSGGMKMRVSLARALITEPEVLFMDEPFSALDESARLILQDELRTLWSQRKMTVIFVTHSMSEATYLSQRAIVLSIRPVRVLLDHSLQLPRARTQATRQSPEFISELSLLTRTMPTGNFL